MSESNFIYISYLLKNSERILNIQKSNDKKNNDMNQTDIPLWIKNNAKWWSNGQINDETFIRSIQYLINNKIILLN